MNSRQIRQSLILLLTAVIWGVAFVAQSVGMDYVGPFTFICARSLIGGLVLLPCITLLDRLNGQQKKSTDRKKLLLGGICCGLALCTASCFQQFGILYTSVGKGAPCTGRPVFSLHDRKPAPWKWRHSGVYLRLSFFRTYPGD